MRKRQTEIASRMLELTEIEKGRVLELGCGAGFVLEFLTEKAFDATGVDVVSGMVKVCRDKGLNAIEADMREIPLGKKFDFILSVSALQWLTSGNEREISLNISELGREVRRLLKTSGQAVFQLYPRSEEQLVKVGKLFSKTGLRTDIVIDNPDNPRRRTCYILLKQSP
jgi:SAM-dependent methyltransferase